MTKVVEEIYGGIIVQHIGLSGLEERLLTKLGILTNWYKGQLLLQSGGRSSGEVDFEFPKPHPERRYTSDLPALNGYKYATIFIPYAYGSSKFEIIIGVPKRKYDANQFRLHEVIAEIVQLANDLDVKIYKPVMHAVEYDLCHVYQGYGEEKPYN